MQGPLDDFNSAPIPPSEFQSPGGDARGLSTNDDFAAGPADSGADHPLGVPTIGTEIPPLPEQAGAAPSMEEPATVETMPPNPVSDPASEGAEDTPMDLPDLPELPDSPFQADQPAPEGEEAQPAPVPSDWAEETQPSGAQSEMQAPSQEEQGDIEDAVSAASRDDALANHEDHAEFMPPGENAAPEAKTSEVGGEVSPTEYVPERHVIHHHENVKPIFVEAHEFYDLLQEIKSGKRSIRDGDATIRSWEEADKKFEEKSNALLGAVDTVQEQLMAIDTKLFEK